MAVSGIIHLLGVTFAYGAYAAVAVRTRIDT